MTATLGGDRLATNPAAPAALAMVSGTVYRNTTGSNLVITAAVAATVAGTAQWALGPTASPSAWGGATTTIVGTAEKNLTVPAGWYYSLTVTGTATITAQSRTE
ncbi:MAG TPA: hypothetical protein VMV23_05470 [Candidatus Nanopelagicaceae bacterium]|nr:hypothetical protein [Candidatus Nanopelagicaceae bacterium]